MNIKDTVNKLIKDNNTSHSGLAKKLGYRSPGSIGNVVSRGNMKVNMLASICEVLGYEIIIRPKYGDNKAERTIKLDEHIEDNDNRGKWK